MTGRWTWAAGLAVAAAAAVATAHGCFEVARAAGAPIPIAGLYPAISDGLALVAYAATVRLVGGARRYAWTVVVVAAGLSGLAQAAWLGGGVRQAPVGLRFGVGAWPAIAAAVVAHLLFLLGSGDDEAGPRAAVELDGAEGEAVLEHLVQPVLNTLDRWLYSPSNPVQPAESAEPMGSLHFLPATGQGGTTEVQEPDGPRARAVAAARDHRDRTGHLPSVSDLATAADVSRGTAATALRHLRADRPSTHSVTDRPSEELDR
jgi:hypothetical protein